MAAVADEKAVAAGAAAAVADDRVVAAAGAAVALEAAVAADGCSDCFVRSSLLPSSRRGPAGAVFSPLLPAAAEDDPPPPPAFPV